MSETLRAAWSQSATVIKNAGRHAYACTPGPGIACVANDIVGKASHSPLLLAFFDAKTDLAQFFNAAFKTAIVVGAMLAVLRLGYAGFMYMMSDVWSNKEKAKGIIQEALLGLLLLIAAYLILNQINPNLLNLNILRIVTPAPTSQAPAQSSSQSNTQATRPDLGTRTTAPSGSWCSDTGNQCYATREECTGWWPFTIPCTQKQ